MRRAHVVAVGQRGQALHVHSEQTRERVRLCLAQLGELPGDVLHRAVPLAELRCRRIGAPPRTVARVPVRRSAPRRAPASAARGRPPRPRAPGGTGAPARRPAARRRRGRRSSPAVARRYRRAEVARSSYSAGRQRVAPVGGDVPAGGPPPSAPGQRHPPDGDQLVGGQRVEVTPDRRRRQPEPLGEAAGAHRPLLQHGAPDPVARARVRRRRRGRRPEPVATPVADFHTTIVTLFDPGLNPGVVRRPSRHRRRPVAKAAGRRRAGRLPTLRDVPAPAVEVTGLVKRYGGRTVVDGLTLQRRRRRRHRRPGPQRRGQDHDDRVLRGPAPPGRGRRPRPRPGPRPRRRPAAAPGRRHAPGRRPADRGTRRRGAAARRRPARAPRRPRPPGRRARPRARPADHRPPPVRRSAPAAGARAGRRRPARGRLPRRADRRPRPAGAARGLGR